MAPDHWLDISIGNSRVLFLTWAGWVFGAFQLMIALDFAHEVHYSKMVCHVTKCGSAAVRHFIARPLFCPPGNNFTCSQTITSGLFSNLAMYKSADLFYKTFISPIEILCISCMPPYIHDKVIRGFLCEWCFFALLLYASITIAFLLSLLAILI